MAKKSQPAVVATPKKKTNDTIRKPQLRVMAVLAKSKQPLTRAEISKRGEVDLAFLTEYIGSSDKAIRTKNDKRFKSLITFGYVKDADQDGATVYTITAAGKKALAAAK